jgi:hypothetical protein
VTLRRTSYDYEAACARIAAESGFEGAAEWAEEYVHARNSAEDALAAFGPLDGRGEGGGRGGRGGRTPGGSGARRVTDVKEVADRSGGRAG